MLENLDSLPDNEPYLWADYLEIWATVSIDKCFSRGELASICVAQAKPKNRAFQMRNGNGLSLLLIPESLFLEIIILFTYRKIEILFI